LARRYRSEILVRQLSEWIQVVREESAQIAVKRLSNFNEWNEKHWERHQQRLLNAIADGTLTIHEELLGKHLGRVHVTIGDRRDGICFYRKDGTWHMLASVFDWTAMPFNETSDEEDSETTQLNGELMCWQADALQDENAKAFAKLLGGAAARGQL
jgi:hypothetical protein